MNSFIRSVGRIARADAALFRRFPRYFLAVLVISAVPALYALIYLSSVWDPNAQTPALPVAIVNLDRGVQYRGNQVNVGAELTRDLQAAGTFGFRLEVDAERARQNVRQGLLAFAVVIPPDFSANAVPGLSPGGGKVTVVVSEGNNYASAGMARRFAEDLGHLANERLNEQRWEQVLASADGSGRSLVDLRAGIVQLGEGLRELDASLARYTGSAVQLASGVRQAGADLRQIHEKLPPDAELKALKNGSQRLIGRQRELSVALELVRGGADRLAADGGPMREQAGPIATPADTAPAVAGELVAAQAQLRDGLQVSLEANNRLGMGLTRAEAGVAKVADDVARLGEGVQQLASRLPPAAILDAVAAGGRSLAEATGRLRAGVDVANTMLPASAGKPDGSARGLADSVEPELEVLAPVANNGSAFAPNMVAMALWLGAVMVVYLCDVRTVARSEAQAPRLALGLGKFAVPMAIVLAQALCVLLMLVFGLGIHVPRPGVSILVMAVAAVAFLALVVLLLRAFGEAGKLIAVLLLTVQLAAGGGVLPIELSGELFRAMHPWLPFTWVVRAMRASLFGAFGGGWWYPVGVVAGAGLAALVATAWVGRWRVVDEADLRPPVEA